MCCRRLHRRDRGARPARQDGNLSGAGWAWPQNCSINTAGFAIVGVFVLTWIVALAIWRLAKIEQKWDTANATAQD
jgi:nickel/cobalt transporter (NiCoT) family protein